MQGRRLEIKQTSLIPMKNNGPRLFSHRKTKSNHLLEKKPQILLMKWNNFVSTYHFFKQLTSINGSFNSINTSLKKKKQEMMIHDVPYIESQQISVCQKQEDTKKMAESANTECVLKGSSKTKTSQIQTSKSIKQSRQTTKQKIVVSIRLSEKSGTVEEKVSGKEKSEENFTDEEGGSDCQQEKMKKEESTNKNSKLQFSFEGITDSLDHYRIEEQHHVAQNLRKTAFFSFEDQERKRVNLVGIESKRNQENVNNLNRQIKSKKVEVLLKLQSQQEIRRQKAQKIIKQDRQYLTNLMKRK